MVNTSPSFGVFALRRMRASTFRREHPAALATEHALMAVATMPFNHDVLALFSIAYPSRAEIEIESAELPHPVRALGFGGGGGGRIGGTRAESSGTGRSWETCKASKLACDDKSSKETMGRAAWEMVCASGHLVKQVELWHGYGPHDAS